MLAVLCISLVVFAGFIYSVLHEETIYPGISVDGISMGGLTRQEALVLLRENIGAAIPRDAILLITPHRQYRLPLHDIGYEAEYGKALDVAYSKGREGNIVQRLTAIRNLRRKGLQIIAEMCYNQEKTVKILDSIRQDTEKKPRNANITIKSGKIKVTPHQTGLMMDMALSMTRVEKSLLGRTLEDTAMCIVEIVPDITEEMLGGITYKLGEFRTAFNTDNEGRAHNIKTACAKIDQKVLLPAQIFSMDKTLGSRTEKNGYKQAKVIINNELVDGLGGGICQVTSTFYNSVLLSGLEVLERRNHTLPLTYIDVGRDATISQGYIDFKFKNNLGYAILVEARIVGSQVVVAVWGRKPVSGNTMKIRTKIIERIDAEGVETEVDPTLKPGQSVVVREAIPGYRVEVYRDTIDPSGKVIKTEKISVDKYQPRKKKVKVSPTAVIEPIEGDDLELTGAEGDQPINNPE